jgi:hypothetical protein
LKVGTAKGRREKKIRKLQLGIKEIMSTNQQKGEEK